MVEPAPGETRQESRREFDPTFITEKDPEYMDEVENDVFSPVIKGDTLPRVKITTEPENQQWLIPFGESLQSVIPNSVFVQREEVPFETIRQTSIEEGFTDLLVLTGAKEAVYAMTHIHLPNGPSAAWRITSIMLPKDIQGHATPTSHYPEVVMQRFSTRLGLLCSRMLRALFPAQPQYEGRMAVSFHQQRDFIFFRHYRYIFESKEDVRTQESGPRFTMRLIWLQESGYDPENGVYTFYRRQRHETSRRKWAL